MLCQFLTRRELSTVEPLNKDTFGTSASLLSLVKRLYILYMQVDYR